MDILQEKWNDVECQSNVCGIKFNVQGLGPGTNKQEAANRRTERTGSSDGSQDVSFYLMGVKKSKGGLCTAAELV